jgi:hypothetical protein
MMESTRARVHESTRNQRGLDPLLVFSFARALVLSIT